MIADYTVDELTNLLQDARVYNNKSKQDSPLAKSVTLVNIETGHTKHFASLGLCTQYLKNLGYKADQRTLIKRLDTDIAYYGYKCYRFITR